MGQVFDKLEGKEWRKGQIREITNRVFDKLQNQKQADNLSFEDLYIAVLLVYNDINKYIPGPHFDPPPKARVKEFIKSSDINMNGKIDRDEFFDFILQITADIFTVVSQNLIFTLVVAPTVAVVTKKAVEGVPGVGRLVQKIPNSVYSSLVTIAIMWFQRKAQDYAL